MFLPTSPYIATDGAITSLVGMASRDKITISGNAPISIGPNANVTFTSNQISVEIAASVGFGSMVDLNMEANTHFYLIELHTVNQAVDGMPGSIINKEYYGVSIRICIKAWGFAFDSNVNVGFVAAKASANAAAVAYQVDVLGIRSSDLLSLPGLISGSIGPFDVAKLQAVGASFDDMVRFVADNPEECKPELVGVDIDLAKAKLPFEKTSSSMYALGRIRAGVDYTDAVVKIPSTPDNVPNIEEDSVRALFEAIIGSTTSAPNATQSKLARNILDITQS